VFAVLVASVPALAQVTIDGGLDREQFRYVWTVTNGGSEPIVSLQFPHFHALVLTAPDGWESEVTNRATDKTGVVTAEATSPRAGIPPGRSATFTLTFAPRDCAPGSNAVTITFGDGSTATVLGVKVPWRTPWLQRFTLLIGLGGIFAIYVFVQAARGRRRKTPPNN